LDETRRVLSLRRPDDGQIRSFLAGQQELPLSYEAPGMTGTGPPPGWDVGRDRAELGTGPAVYARARAAVDRWAMFDVGWVELCWPDRPPAPGCTVAVLARLGPLWSLNACRVVDASPAGDDADHHGFAYGTLDEHMERGEERFEVRWERASDRVVYEVVAYSQPRHWLARASGPLARAAQARFRAHSGRAMQRAVRRG
jgi:uncharacterized protein (UPF0548 family)